jgi:hypothetical protein
MTKATKQQKTASTDNTNKHGKVKGPVPDFKKQAKVKLVPVVTPLLYFDVPKTMMAFVYAEPDEETFDDKHGPRQAAWTAAEEAIKSYAPAARSVLKQMSDSALKTKSHRDLDRLEENMIGAIASMGGFSGRLRFWKFVGYILQGIHAPGVRFNMLDEDGHTASERAEALKKTNLLLKEEAKQMVARGCNPQLYSCGLNVDEDGFSSIYGKCSLSVPVPASDISEANSIYYHPLSEWAR